MSDEHAVPPERITEWVAELCARNRNVGEPGNVAANGLFERVADDAGWVVESSEFDCLRWNASASELRADVRRWDLHPGPYSAPASLEAELVVARTVEELESVDARGAVLLVGSPLAAGQLTPRGYPFYTNESSERILRALDAASPAAVIAATGADPGLAGGASPFPWAEDGAFGIPSAYLHEDDAGDLFELAGSRVAVDIRSSVTPASARQVWATLPGASASRVVVTAHIDAKASTPGALDNATGVATLMALAELLGGEKPARTIELVPFNGEDHYAAPGEMVWLGKEAREHPDDPPHLVFNIDGAGWRDRTIQISSYGIDDATQSQLDALMADSRVLEPGPPWYQGDHMIFAMRGTPTFAATTSDATGLFGLTHTERDAPELVDASAIVELAELLAALARA